MIAGAVGPLDAEIAFYGEAPGHEEDRIGVPFIGKSGRLFDEILAKVGLHREDVIISNVVRCVPTDWSTSQLRPPGQDEVDACRIHTERELSQCHPKVIVALGAVAAKALTGNKRSISKIRGIPHMVEIVGESRTIVPTFHPAHALRSGGVSGAVASQIEGDIRRALALIHPVAGGTYRIVDSDNFGKFLREANSWDAFAFDIETDGLDPFRSQILGVSFSGKAGEGWYYPLLVWNEGIGELVPYEGVSIDAYALQAILSNDARKTAHNGKFDVLRLKTLLGIEVRNWTFDSMLAAHLLDENRRNYSLEDLSGRYPDLVGYKTKVKQMFGTGDKREAAGKFARLSLAEIGEYSGKDSDATFRLSCDLRAELDAEPTLAEFFDRFVMPTARTLTEMEAVGMAVDVDYMKALGVELNRDMDCLLAEIRQEADVPDLNVNSSPQMIEVLFVKRRNPIMKRTAKRNKPAVDIEVLANLAEGGDRVAELTLQYREMHKIVSTYVEPMGELIALDGRVHTTFHQSRVVTGRLASSDPNLQNIPVRSELGRRARGIFVAALDHSLICCDYSQMELRVLAWVSQDPVLLDACRNDVDLHLVTARRIHGRENITDEERQRAKTLNFSVLYGAEAPKVAKQLGISTRAAGEFILQWFMAFPAVRNWIDEIYQVMERDGRVVGPFGRIRRLPTLKGIPLHTSDPEIAHTRRQAVNSIIQGCSSDITCFNMNRVAEMLHHGDMAKLGARVILQVHDAVYVECPDRNLDIVKPLVEEMLSKPVDPVDVLLKVDVKVVKRWGSDENG